MKKINLLILDDKEENIISLEALLSEIKDINIISTTDPNHALKICWKNEISIALVDVQMPDINGFEFVSLLKENPKTSHILVIMVTAISKEDKFLLQGLQSGAIDYLYKPLNPEITIAKVKSFIKQIHIQEEIIQKNHELEVSKLALIKANKEAEDARKSKEIFLANMSHEIRTPINGIVGIVHMLKGQQLPPEQKDWVNRLGMAADTLLLIINDILDISKIDSSMMRIEYEDFNLPNLMRDIENLFRIKNNEKEIDFVVSIDPDIPKYVRFDPLRLQQILSNFISNSFKFTEKGSIQFVTELVERKGEKATIRFMVKDTGIGIKKDAVEKIFMAFEQADEGITKKFGGTGLGLAIVKKLADLLHGTVEAQSEYGKGSEFSFTAVMTEVVPTSPPQPNTTVAYSQLPKLHTLKVLVAEDNDLNSFTLCHILRTWGCDVTIVKNGLIALESIERKEFDIVLMDTHMPIMSGFEAITQIRKADIKHNRHIPIITISASVLEHEQKAAFEVGADDVIAKPFNPLELYQKIVKLCPSPPKAPISENTL